MLLLARRGVSTLHVPRLVPRVVHSVARVESYGTQSTLSPARARPGLGEPEAAALVLSSCGPPMLAELEVAAGTRRPPLRWNLIFRPVPSCSMNPPYLPKITRLPRAAKWVTAMRGARFRQPAMSCRTDAPRPS